VAGSVITAWVAKCQGRKLRAPSQRPRRTGRRGAPVYCAGLRQLELQALWPPRRVGVVPAIVLVVSRRQRTATFFNLAAVRTEVAYA